MIRLIFLAFAALMASPALAQKLDDTPRTVVMTAFYPEWHSLVPTIKDAKEHKINGSIFLTGTLEGKPVVLMQSGVSVVNAAMSTQIVLDRFTVKRIVFSGIAGGVDPALSIGDVVVAENWGQYLEGSFARRTKKGWLPPDEGHPESPANWNFIFPRGTLITSKDAAMKRVYRIPVDGELLALAKKVVPTITLERCVPPSDKMRADSALCLPQMPKIVVGGTGVTAGIYADNAAFRIYLQKAWKARVLDMESAAVMQVAMSNSVPAIVFRSLSDLAGGDPHKNMEYVFEHLASANSAHVVRAFVAALPD
ncbi:5'-methylthioadenosine/S-adenosylhomocysteine nucleosidase [Novosphingobium sp.]|uniref:5'-methylthioadenosine/S-adenosylhomocysteine nucleosidase n=1 Tax=Novosphingobium sp. TaxID=1874826 RepID=UPI001DBEAD7E|nr:5'-methylthioadenosine/S-adenosylhomocysteine nucleosidase [Novosphingobium sp.]MBX9662635.1 5'-methylthioadenosine/S-adenosylhomocysteine nucleosidase [Novosphingobium sp.]